MSNPVGSDATLHVAMPTSPTSENDLALLTSEHDDRESSENATLHRRRAFRQKDTTRIVSLIFATLSSLCAGSIVVFSLYAPQLQSRLHYSQFQVNGLAIASSLALYLPISIMGLVCDRIGVSPLALLSAMLFGTGYGTAAFVYRRLDVENNDHKTPGDSPHLWAYPVMIVSFICIGSGTCAMYIASVSTCAKNFGKGRYRGLALAMPIAGFGLSGLWLSQFASRFLNESNSDGSTGDVDVFRFFLFLAVLLAVMGVLGVFLLRVIDADDLIDEAIEELETSGLLDSGSMTERSRGGYTSISPHGGESLQGNDEALMSRTHAIDSQWKRHWILNIETRQFLTDRTMWLFAVAFLLMIGPGEAFVNNLGTVIGTLTPPSAQASHRSTSAATQVSVFGATSTLARLLIGSLTDVMAPSPETQHVQFSSSSFITRQHQYVTISRVVFLLFFALLMSLGFVILASGMVQNHADRFSLVSGLVGAGYGAIFSLVPLIITIVWGVENFATNFGIVAMLPALGSTFWGLVYSAVYQAGTKRTSVFDAAERKVDALFCYGTHCYSSTFWAESICVWIACFLVIYAWKGRGGWQQRGIVI